MIDSIATLRRPLRATRVLVLTLGASAMLVGAPAESLGYEQFFGIIHVMPHGKAGTWQIGVHTLSSDEFTEIDAYREPLNIGACARVVMRHDVATQIVTVAMDHCEAKRDDHPGVGG
jgi:hypothetical protein